MKKGLIIYIVMSLLFLVAIYFVTVSSIITDSQNEFNNKIFSEARETKNFDQFVAYQTKEYKLIDSYDENEYRLVTYHFNSKDDKQGLLFIIIPLKDVKIADSAKDSNDKTKVLITDTLSKESFIDTSTKDVSISYGLNSKNVGFMFFDIVMREKNTIKVTYYDYEGNQKIDKTFNEIALSSSTELETFNKGYTLEEVKEAMGYESELKKALITRITIYIIVVIFAPFIYRLIKTFIIRKRETGNRKLS
ncbi:hypothetical protein [Haploplasma axanthum]|nr:hypothetical protein [Haploplasma axanthum]